jgi:hypothetical protein
MRFLAWPLLLLWLLAGCTSDPSPTTTAVQPPPLPPVRKLKSKPPSMPAFRGESPKMLLKWDLSGNWTVSRISSKEKPGKLGPWEEKWTLRKVKTPAQLQWKEEHGKGDFVLTDRLPQMLIWDHTDGSTWYFSINEQSPGLLVMTGNDGERYKAVRSGPATAPAEATALPE